MANQLHLVDPVSILPGVGKVREQQLSDMGINTIRDLLLHIPFRYETIEQSAKISDLKDGTNANFQAEVVSKIPIKTRRFRSMIKVRVADDTGSLDLIWFNTPFVLSSLAVGQKYFFTGKVSEYKGKLSITNPTFEREPPELGALVPIYHESAEINSRFLRRLIKSALDSTDLEDASTMHPVYGRQNLPSLEHALRSLHLPATLDPLSTSAAAKRRLAFDEMFGLISSVLSRKTEHITSKVRSKLKIANHDITEFEKLLPYPLTDSQKEAIQNIALDLVQPHPMKRLLQGEVGSGKTTVAAFALSVAASQKAPAFLVCPTKILAEQHFKTLSSIFNHHLSIGLFTGKEKAPDADILVGTHALFNLKGVKPSLVVVDEEHRFGVKQRESFFTGNRKPHYLSMTATPIPRTVALTALADQDISFIYPHKQNDNIKTWVVPEAKRPSAYHWIIKTLAETKGQAMIVCPFIEESFAETLVAVKSAKKEFETLKQVFGGLKLELLHGKMKEEEKSKVFGQMMTGKTDILVATPVVEVGVDIPGANIIIVEGAERYGLAALHQLRGRVGRRGQSAYCLLFTTDDTVGTSRLEYFSGHYDGNMLAEYDLKRRGSGELLGLKQSGFELKFAAWGDTNLIEACRQEVNLLQ